tara:strand:+ start:4990 stop:5178 length:189 start_codon:yes stop_codon:yes gene_type:complete
VDNIDVTINYNTMNNKIRKFTHYALLTWAFTLGAFATLGIAYMIYGLLFLDFASAANFGIYR